MLSQKECRGWRVKLLGSAVAGILALVLMALISLPQDATLAADRRILVEQATATWEAPLAGSSVLEGILGQASPRLLIEHAATTWMRPSEESAALESSAAEVGPRIRLDYSATSSLVFVASSPESVRSTAGVSPRPLIEHAATSALLAPLSGDSVAEEVSAGGRILIEHAATSAVESPISPPGLIFPAQPAPVPSTSPPTLTPTAVKPATAPALAATTPTTTAPTTPAPSTTKPATASTQPTTMKPTTTAARPSAPVKPAPTARHSSLLWLWLLCGVAVVVLAALGVRAYRRRDKDRAIGDSAPTAQQHAPVTVATSPAPSRAQAPAETRQAARQDRARPNASALSRRSPAAVFLLPFVTFGIYALYWLVRTKTELNAAGAQIPTAILLIIPIANLYWLWKFGEGVDYLTDRRMSTGVAFLLVLFLDIIGSAIIQSQLNQVER